MTLTTENDHAETALRLKYHEQTDDWNGADSSPTLTNAWPYRGLFTLSRSWYQITDLRRMEGLVSHVHLELPGIEPSTSVL